MVTETRQHGESRSNPDEQHQCHILIPVYVWKANIACQDNFMYQACNNFLAQNGMAVHGIERPSLWVIARLRAPTMVSHLRRQAAEYPPFSMCLTTIVLDNH